MAVLHLYLWLKQASGHDGLLEGRIAFPFSGTHAHSSLPTSLQKPVYPCTQSLAIHHPPKVLSLLSTRHLHASSLYELLLAPEAALGVPSLDPSQTLLGLNVWVSYSIFPFSFILPVTYIKRKMYLFILAAFEL